MSDSGVKGHISSSPDFFCHLITSSSFLVVLSTRGELRFRRYSHISSMPSRLNPPISSSGFVLATKVSIRSKSSQSSSLRHHLIKNCPSFRPAAICRTTSAPVIRASSVHRCRLFHFHASSLPYFFYCATASAGPKKGRIHAALSFRLVAFVIRFPSQCVESLPVFPHQPFAIAPRDEAPGEELLQRDIPVHQQVG